MFNGDHKKIVNNIGWENYNLGLEKSYQIFWNCVITEE